jgi:hypothetical protein
MRYTNKVHAKNILAMLESGKNFEEHCPAESALDRVGLKPGNRGQCMPIHNICRKFAGLKRVTANKFYTPPGDTCPCYMLGCAEAVKRTWLYLEENGYI